MPFPSFRHFDGRRGLISFSKWNVIVTVQVLIRYHPHHHQIPLLHTWFQCSTAFSDPQQQSLAFPFSCIGVANISKVFLFSLQQIIKLFLILNVMKMMMIMINSTFYKSIIITRTIKSTQFHARTRSWRLRKMDVTAASVFLDQSARCSSKHRPSLRIKSSLPSSLAPEPKIEELKSSRLHFRISFTTSAVRRRRIAIRCKSKRSSSPKIISSSERGDRGLKFGILFLLRMIHRHHHQHQEWNVKILRRHFSPPLAQHSLERMLITLRSSNGRTLSSALARESSTRITSIVIHRKKSHQV